jgi:hypothetical protein
MKTLKKGERFYDGNGYTRLVHAGCVEKVPTEQEGGW